MVEEIRGEFMEFQKLFLEIAPWFVGLFFVFEFDAGALGQTADGIDELKVLVFHHEGEDVAARAASETVPDLLLGIDVEAGRLLFVERAEGAEVRTGPFEREIRTDHLDNIVVLANLLEN